MCFFFLQYFLKPNVFTILLYCCAFFFKPDEKFSDFLFSSGANKEAEEVWEGVSVSERESAAAGRPYRPIPGKTELV